MFKLHHYAQTKQKIWLKRGNIILDNASTRNLMTDHAPKDWLRKLALHRYKRTYGICLDKAHAQSLVNSPPKAHYGTMHPKHTLSVAYTWCYQSIVHIGFLCVSRCGSFPKKSCHGFFYVKGVYVDIGVCVLFKTILNFDFQTMWDF